MKKHKFTVLNLHKMKKDIHPPRYQPTIITCICGNVVHTRSTVPEIKVEICSNCHPFYTGTQKFIDSAGRVDKFFKKYKRAKQDS